jgi:auxin efflux carrier family protein
LSSRYSVSPDHPSASNSLTQGDHTLVPPHAGAHLAPRYFTSFPNTPVYSRSESSDSDLSDDEGNLVFPAGDIPVRRLRRDRIWRGIRVFIHKVNGFMTVPMWAALASIIVACVQPLQHALEQHMQPLKLALNSAGNCSIPLTLVVLGAYFYVPKADEDLPPLVRTIKPRRSDMSLIQSVRKIFVLRGRRKRRSRAGIVSNEEDTDGVRRPGETKTVAVAVLSRMVLTPLILLPLLALFMASGATHVFEE